MKNNNSPNKVKYLKYMSLLVQENQELLSLSEVAKKLDIPKNTLSRYFKDDYKMPYEAFRYNFNNDKSRKVEYAKNKFVDIFKDPSKEYWIISSVYMESERDFMHKELKSLNISSRKVDVRHFEGINWQIPPDVAIILLSVFSDTQVQESVCENIKDNSIHHITGAQPVKSDKNVVPIVLDNVYNISNSDYIKRKNKTKIRVFIDNCLDYLEYQTKDSTSHLVDTQELFLRSK